MSVHARARWAPVLTMVLYPILAGGAAEAQVSDIRVTDAGRSVPVAPGPEEVALGRTMALGLLAGAHRDVTRPVTDQEIEGLGERGTLLQVLLRRPESVYLVRLRSTARPSRIAAYVPPDRDDYAYIFLGHTAWQRIVVVTLPEALRREVRSLRSRPLQR